jgi:hypothetical protein
MEIIMKSHFLFFVLAFFSFQECAYPSTLRVTCDDTAVGAEITVNGQFKGECPVDIQVKGGSLTLNASKIIDGMRKVNEQTIRIGDDVAKRVEISFGTTLGSNLSAPSSETVKIDSKAVALKVYEAEMAEYEKSIQDCLPTHTIEKRRIDQSIKALYREKRNRCIDDHDSSYRDDENYLVMACGPRTWDGRDDTSVFNLYIVPEPEYSEYLRVSDSARQWCERKIKKPKTP